MDNKIQSALAHLNAHDRELWVKVAMAIKSELGEDGFYLWDNWSKSAENYNQADAKAVWKGVKPSGSTGIGTLFYEAKANGWRYDGDYQKPSPLDIAQQRAKHRADSLKQEAKTRAKQKQAAEKACRLWANAKPADPEHPYLKRKGVKPHGLRQIQQGLLVPLSLSREIVNIQTIWPNGLKRFLTGGQIRGAYSAIAGELERIYLCEGWATGATIRQLTGHAVACAMNAGNLLHAGLELRKQYPESELVIAADNDHANKKNTGLHMATDAAKRLNALFVVPEFAAHEKGSDFNDRYLLDLIKTDGGLHHAG